MSEHRPPPHAEGAHIDFSQELSYGEYLHLDRLLDAQHPLTAAHDETLFILIHHVQELWMKLIVHETRSAMARIAAGDPDPAMKMLTRVARAQDQMTNAWEVLKTMTPSDYLEFRNAFGHASGFQSFQYRMIEFLFGNKQPFVLEPFRHQPQQLAALQAALHGPSLYDVSLRLLATKGIPVPQQVLERDFAKPHVSHPGVRDAWLAVYRDTSRHWDLYYLAEKLVDVEDNFRRWRFNHVTTVERLIGHKQGSGGTAGVSYLKKVLETVLFPELWEVRTAL